MDRALRRTLPDGRFPDVPAARSRAMAEVQGKGNRSTESRLRFALVSAGVDGWRLHARDKAGCPDFYFDRVGLAVFVDGCFWHACPKCGHLPKTNVSFWKKKLERNQMRDRRNRHALEKQGIAVIRFWEHELRESLMNCVAKVRAGKDRARKKHRMPSGGASERDVTRGRAGKPPRRGPGVNGRAMAGATTTPDQRLNRTLRWMNRG